MLHLEAHCLNALYVLCSDLLAVRCWTGSVWTVQSSCLNDLAALCTIIHLTGGSQCPAEGVNLLWPLAVHSDKGTSMEYVRDTQCMHIDAYGCISIWTSLFYGEKETLLWLCSKFPFKMICLDLSFLSWWCWHLQTDAVIFHATLVMFVNQSTHVWQLSLFVTNFTTHLESWTAGFKKKYSLLPCPELLQFSLTAVYFESIIGSRRSKASHRHSLPVTWDEVETGSAISRQRTCLSVSPKAGWEDFEKREEEG